MSLLLETIKLENGKLINLNYHNQRFNRARKEIFSLPEKDLADLIQIPKEFNEGTYRCRVVYQKEIEKIEFIPHHPRTINSLQIVHDNDIVYNHKFTNRTHLQKLYEQRDDADEIIIVKNGLVTDCFIGNLVFFDGEKWVTPDQPLLRGTQRQKLLDEGQIQEEKITERDLFNYEMVGIINVFYNLENMFRIATKMIS